MVRPGADTSTCRTQAQRTRTSLTIRLPKPSARPFESTVGRPPSAARHSEANAATAPNSRESPPDASRDYSTRWPRRRLRHAWSASPQQQSDRTVFSSIPSVSSVWLTRPLLLTETSIILNSREKSIPPHGLDHHGTRQCQWLFFRRRALPPKSFPNGSFPSRHRFIISLISAYCFRSAFTSSTVVPLPRAMRRRRLPSIRR